MRDTRTALQESQPLVRLGRPAAGLRHLVACTLGDADWQQFDWSAWDTLGHLDDLGKLRVVVERRAMAAQARRAERAGQVGVGSAW